MRTKVRKKQRRLGFFAGGLLGLFSGKSKPQMSTQKDFRISTKRIGIQFGENIRRFWRNKWVYVKKQDDL